MESIPALAILGVFFAVPATFVLIAWLIIKAITKGRDQRHAEKMAMLQKGLPVADVVSPAEVVSPVGKEENMLEKARVEDKNPDRRLMRGITTGAVGAAFTLYAFIIESKFWLIVGLIPLVIGVTIIPKKMLIRGITSTAIGLILTLYMIVDMDTKWLLAGLIFLFIGLSRIAMHFMMERKKEKEGAITGEVSEVETMDITHE